MAPLPSWTKNTVLLLYNLTLIPSRSSWGGVSVPFEFFRRRSDENHDMFVEFSLANEKRLFPILRDETRRDKTKIDGALAVA